ncbi:MAG TPA: DNA replication and repair protein RecF [Candidatus Saccharimonadales bacterium]
MISDITLKHFRSYKNNSFKFTPGVNIIVGPNASGKTNLLEAILVACEGKSYRVGDLELIEFKQDNAHIELHTDKNDTRIVFLDNNGLKKKTYKINNETLSRLSLSKKIPVVLFEPNNLSMLSGPADLRRQFLDDLLEKTKPDYGSLRRSYRRTLAQRNNLLKRGKDLGKDQLFAWDIRLCDLGEQIARYRHELSIEINKRIEEVYENLSGSKANIVFSYETIVPIVGYGTSLMHKLEEHIQEDRERGFTAYGPHREDISIMINAHPLQASASRGEVRSMVLACKVIEAILVETESGIRPLLLFDDVFSELDNNRRKQLIIFFKLYQTFITTTDADIVARHTPKTANTIVLS